MKKTVFILILLTTGLSVKSQKKFNGFSGSIKLGYDIFSEDIVPVYPEFEVNYYRNNYIFSSIFIYEEEFTLFVSPNKNYNYFDLLFGKYKDYGKIRLKLQAGAGIIYGDKRGKLKEIINGFLFNKYIYEKEPYLNFDMPLQAGISYIPCRYCAIGANINLNMNSEKTLVGAVLCLEFGLLKSK